jgi:perosamine synthetase
MDDDLPADRFELIAALKERGVEGRQIVYPIHQLPPYQDPARAARFPVADRVVHRGLHLPTWAGLTRADVEYVCESLADCLSAINVS